MEENFLKAEKTEKLLRNQIVEAVDEDYIEELKGEFMDYEEHSVIKIFDHLFAAYGQLGIQLQEETMDLF